MIFNDLSQYKGQINYMEQLGSNLTMYGSTPVGDPSFAPATIAPAMISPTTKS